MIGHEPTAGSDYEYVRMVMQQQGVRDHIAKVADQLAKKVAVIAAAEGAGDTPVVRTNGTRPKGRPYARISIPVEVEHGDSKTARLRLLGRVVAQK